VDRIEIGPQEVRRLGKFFLSVRLRENYWAEIGISSFWYLNLRESAVYVNPFGFVPLSVVCGIFVWYKYETLSIPPNSR
jgi:hypothetical protein